MSCNVSFAYPQEKKLSFIVSIKETFQFKDGFFMYFPLILFSLSFKQEALLVGIPVAPTESFLHTWLQTEHHIYISVGNQPCTTPSNICR